MLGVLSPFPIWLGFNCHFSYSPGHTAAKGNIFLIWTFLEHLIPEDFSFPKMNPPHSVLNSITMPSRYLLDLAPASVLYFTPASITLSHFQLQLSLHKHIGIRPPPQITTLLPQPQHRTSFRYEPRSRIHNMTSIYYHRFHISVYSSNPLKLKKHPPHQLLC